MWGGSVGVVGVLQGENLTFTGRGCLIYPCRKKILSFRKFTAPIGLLFCPNKEGNHNYFLSLQEYKMKETKVEVDGYTKFILTVIAVALLGLFLQSFLTPEIASAQKEVINVNIEQIDGRSIDSYSTPAIKVKLAK
jgi:hypothetical protein